MSSAATDTAIDVSVVATEKSPGLEFGEQLASLAEVMGVGRPIAPVFARAALIRDAGDAAAERAIGVVAAFQMMNRLLDGVGAPIHPRLHPTAETLGFRPDDLSR